MRVAIVGGGVIGLCAAHYLERGGASVVLIERGEVGSGCSQGNGGWVCPSISTPLPAPGLTLASLRWLLRPDSPLYIKPGAIPGLARWLWAFRGHCNAESYEAGVAALGALNASTPGLYRGLIVDGVRFERAEAGTLLGFSDPSGLERTRVELSTLADFGVGPAEQLDRDGLAAAEPDLGGDLVGGLLVRSDSHVRPESLCAGLRESLVLGGVSILDETEVLNFVRDGGAASGHGPVRAALTADGEIEADAFIVAAGAETGRLARALGTPLPVQAGKGYSITVDEPRAALSRPVYLDGPKMGFTPFAGALRTLGTMELSGINRRPDRRRIAYLERAARRYLPGALEGSRRVDWVGMRPVTPDGLPAIGRLPGAPNAYVATGHQMLGITLAPSTGSALAQVVLEGRADVDLGPFDPARFG